MYLFASDENTHCPLFFSLKETVASRDGCISTSLARDPVKRLSTYIPHPPHSVQNQVTEEESALNSSIIAMEAMGRGDDFSSTSAEVKFLGLAC